MKTDAWKKNFDEKYELWTYIALYYNHDFLTSVHGDYARDVMNYSKEDLLEAWEFLRKQPQREFIKIITPAMLIGYVGHQCTKVFEMAEANFERGKNE